MSQNRKLERRGRETVEGERKKRDKEMKDRKLSRLHMKLERGGRRGKVREKKRKEVKNE